MGLLDRAASPDSVPEFLLGGGEMGQRIRTFNWAATALGTFDKWPLSLQSALSICLNSNFPIAIYWGDELSLLYNDAWSPIPGNKHPWALGQPARAVWPEIWNEIEPQYRMAFGGTPGGSHDALLMMQRHGYTEECYFDFTFTPIFGDKGAVEGVFNAVIETTYRVLNERRTAFLQRFAGVLASASSEEEIFREAMLRLTENPVDIPFALVYKISNEGRIELHAASAGIGLEQLTQVEWPVADLLSTGRPVHLQEVAGYFKDRPPGPWPEPTREACICALRRNDGSVTGFLFMGVNARRSFDNEYQAFMEAVAASLSSMMNNVRAMEEERMRSEALAEIDRAKTIFFSNISHEFRTPLTLLLGPISDVLADPATSPESRIRMEMAYRNVLRMQKLVNTLLEFSRIEAGRVEGRYTRLDICRFTRDLASTFRSTIEKAGMELDFRCEPVWSDVYVDTEMWERIVLNLISNAFKYSNGGTIGVRLRQTENNIVLNVSDNGIGIPPDEVHKIFDRFHRVEQRSGGKSQEGTGIGLAMVKELVKLHNGSISVSSRLGEGSDFRVTIPVGRDHLPPAKIIDTSSEMPVSINSDAFVQEAMKWVSDDGEGIPETMTADPGGVQKPQALPARRAYTILLADDNADMRDYVKRLLIQRYHVITAVNGPEAYDRIAKIRPDLILTDIMMPGMNGFELIARVKAHPDLKSIPVIILSARAGEEAEVEGLDAGANDYLVKPFLARELIARVDACIKIAKSRAESEERLRNIIMHSPVAMGTLMGESFVVEIINDHALKVLGQSYDEVIGRQFLEVFPDLASQNLGNMLKEVYRTGMPFSASELPVTFSKDGISRTVFLSLGFQPIFDASGAVEGIVGVGMDVSEEVASRMKIEMSRRELNEMANAMPQLVWVANPEGHVLYYNDRVQEFAGAERSPGGGWLWHGLVHPDDLPATERTWNNAVRKGIIYQTEHRIKMKDGSFRWFLSRGVPQKDEHGRVLKWFGTATDIHMAKEQSSILEQEVMRRTRELKEINISLQQSNNDLQQFAHVASHDLKEPLRKIRIFTGRLADDPGSVFSSRGKTFMEKINSAADRMASMIEGVLNYSMINAADAVTQPASLERIIENICVDLELLILEKNATIEAGRLPEIECAEVLIYQMFYNLINNSIKFSRNGVPPVIKISSTTIMIDDREFAEIRIQDNGIGFEESHAEKIFDMFSRLNSKDRFEGTGLGLSLCKRIVQRHGGSIAAFGKKNDGALFVVKLPLRQQSDTL